MDRHRRRQTKLSKTIPTADPQEVSALLDLLFYATKENNAYCARLCNVNRATWRKWNTQPPTAWYWPHVLRLAIKHTLSSIIAQRRATSIKFQNDVRNQLSKIPHNRDFEAEIANMAYDIRGAEAHLRDLLTPRGRWWSNIKLTANLGGYSKQTIRKAAKKLGVIMTQEGYGDEKDSYWRLPNEDED